MKYGLIGKTLTHSYSKEIHEALGQYQYELFSLTENEMPDFIKARDFGGLNVTIPYKKDVMALCDEVSSLASSIGAVNTLYWDGDRLIGHNTDYAGFLYAAKHASIDFNKKTVLILGSGGTSLTARKAASDNGAAKIYIASRSAKISDKNSSLDDTKIVQGEKVKASAYGYNENTSRILSHANTQTSKSNRIIRIAYSQLKEIADEINIIINTTPVGTYPGNLKSVITLSDFPSCESVIDVIYNPFKTKLLLDAEAAGMKFSNGLPMLVAQATAAAGYFLGKPGIFENKNEEIIDKLKNQMENIVLIGMPGCGKSTIGKLLSVKKGKRFIDMDEEIEKRAGMSIPNIFQRFGEKHFRDLESEVAFDLGKEHGLIIATGGGSVLRNENVQALRQNGKILHILRDIDTLSTEGRPLSTDITTLRKMAARRLPIYTSLADVTFDNSLSCPENILAEKLETSKAFTLL